MEYNNLVLELSDNKEYIVIESVEYDNKTYLYLVNKDNQLDSIFREIIDAETLTLAKIDKKLFSNKIMHLFIEKYYNKQIYN